MKVSKRPKKFKLFCGEVGVMDVDLNTYFWGGGEVLLNYTATLGRKIYEQPSLNLVNMVEKRWDGLFTCNFKLKWNNMWTTPRSRIEVRFIWAIWSKVVTVNVWRMRINISIDQLYPLCKNGKKKIMHRF